jgi:glucose-1-phosphate adenylyltransferase
LTDNRAKPAVYFGGVSRIIDFALSNAINSGIRRIGVATQYKAHSLIRHMNRAWNFMRPERNESFDILPAPAHLRAAVVRRHRRRGVPEHRHHPGPCPKHMVILAGDHIYKMDYELMLQQHVNSGADVTIGASSPRPMPAALA